MFKLLLLSTLTALVVGQFTRPLVFRPFPEYFNSPYIINQYNLGFEENYNLCTYTDISYEKCRYFVEVARNNSVLLALECVREESREDCINSVVIGASDMVVLNGHGYKPARNANLKPYIFALEDDSSLYIAVAPRNITFLGVQEAPIYFDQSKHRAFHAATLFNYRMGHDICSFLEKVSLEEYIQIVDSAKYVPNPEEILICPDRIPGEFENYKSCNVEAGLQRAVFVRSNVSPRQAHGMRNVFDNISKRFGSSSPDYKFFDTFQGQDDVIFKNNTISFDLEPTYRNGVDERIFNYLHCDQDDQPHDPRVLL